jgi:DNA-binding XRE family transcriptional regulator
MNKKYPKKIQGAIDRGIAIPYREIFNAYPKEKQERILARARYAKMAMHLRELRKKKKLSQAALAKKMKVKREYISRLESGQQNITLNTLYKIGAVVGKEVEVVFK